MKTKNKINLGLIVRILSYTKPYKNLFFLALVLTLCLASLSIARPLLIKEALNSGVGKQLSFTHLNYFCLFILLSLFIEAVFQIINMRITNILGQNIVRDLRNQVYTHILKLKNSYFDNTPVGMLVTRAISDIESLSDVFAQGFIVIAGDIVMLLVFVFVMLQQNWVLALLAFSTIPLLFVATALFKRGVKKTFTMVRNAVSNLNTFTQEHITGMRLVQLFNKEEAEYNKFKAINNEHRVANIKSIFYYSVFFPVVEILSSVSVALIIWFAGFHKNSLNINIGDITFFNMMVGLLFRPIRMLADRLNTLQMGIVSAERVFKVIDTNAIIEEKGTKVFEKVKNAIEFKHVFFAYKEEQFVLKGVNLSFEANKTYAIVGATGAGKSTIINLLSRFYEYNKGEILIDNINIRNYGLESLRKNTGVVLQDVHLFNDSVLNNITLNNQQITPEQVSKATEKIGLLNYIHSLPGGFNYQVTERGQSLSAGQKQLIAFIRAYVYQPSIFILDEATATIDSNTEQLIKIATERIAKDRTAIIIAHRLSTIKNVDKIFVFEDGLVTEEGSFNELLLQNGRFKNLYDLSLETA